MAYGMVCDHCGVALKIDDNVVRPYTSITVVSPEMHKPVKLRYCMDCTEETILEPMRKVQEDFSEQMGSWDGE